MNAMQHKRGPLFLGCCIQWLDAESLGRRIEIRYIHTPRRDERRERGKYVRGLFFSSLSVFFFFLSSFDSAVVSVTHTLSLPPPQSKKPEAASGTATPTKREFVSLSRLSECQDTVPQRRRRPRMLFPLPSGSSPASDSSFYFNMIISIPSISPLSPFQSSSSHDS